MTNITLKNIPDALYVRLKEAAAVNHRSLNSEILYCVEQTLSTHKININEHLEVARRLRNKTAKIMLTDEILTAVKNDGRP